MNTKEAIMTSRYYCKKCGSSYNKIPNTDKDILAETKCPFCEKTELIYQERCENCGSWHAECDIQQGLCDRCREEIRESLKEEITLNVRRWYHLSEIEYIKEILHDESYINSIERAINGEDEEVPPEWFVFPCRR